VRGDLDDDVDQPPALAAQENREPPDQTRTGAAVERLVIGQSGDDGGEVVTVVRRLHATLRSSSDRALDY
jgi:hypothetical protein